MIESFKKDVNKPGFPNIPSNSARFIACQYCDENRALEVESQWTIVHRIMFYIIFSNIYYLEKVKKHKENIKSYIKA